MNVPKENILIVGSGAREHALGFRLQSPQRKLYFSPGNAGTTMLGENVLLSENQVPELTQFAKEHKIDLTVVGPETSIALGITNAFQAEGLPIFAPTQEAGRLESSKAWAVQFMQRHGIAHPASEVFDDPQKALEFLDATSWVNPVIKASGLASGKGVLLPNTKEEAARAVQKIMVEKEFGEAGNEIVVQERLSGQEISILAFSDGKTVVPLLAAQDHKRLLDGDKGPNTGGMGAYAPVAWVTPELMEKIQTTILEPTIAGMHEEGIPFKGVLFAGLIITQKGPVVIEHNVRFGDPETQPLMMLLESDLATVMRACIDEKLHPYMVKFRDGFAATVVLAAQGYPENPIKGTRIYGLDNNFGSDVQIFHAGTKEEGSDVLTNGGRVLSVTARGNNKQEALQKAYACIGANGVYFDGMHYRHDIGSKE